MAIYILITILFTHLETRHRRPGVLGIILTIRFANIKHFRPLKRWFQLLGDAKPSKVGWERKFLNVFHRLNHNYQNWLSDIYKTPPIVPCAINLQSFWIFHDFLHNFDQLSRWVIKISAKITFQWHCWDENKSPEAKVLNYAIETHF